MGLAGRGLISDKPGTTLERLICVVVLGLEAADMSRPVFTVFSHRTSILENSRAPMG